MKNLVVDTKKIAAAKASITDSKRVTESANAVHAKGTAYQAITSQTSQVEPQRVLTFAAMIICNACQWGTKGLVVKSTKTFNQELFNRLTNGGNMSGYHKGKGRMNQDGLTLEGLNFFNGALSGTEAWKAKAVDIRKLAKVMGSKKGGQVTLEGGHSGYSKVVLKAVNLVQGSFTK